MKSNRLSLGLRSGILALLVIANAGCNQSGQSQKTAIHYVLDGSGSVAATTDQEIAAMVIEIESAPVDAEITVSVMASKTIEIFSGSLANTEPYEIARIARSALASPDPVKGTDLSAMAVAVYNWTTRTDAKVLKVRVMSDGGDDFAKDPKRAKAYTYVASKIVKDKRVASLIFHGVKVGYREPIRAHFGELGPKLKILSAGESSFE